MRVKKAGAKLNHLNGQLKSALEEYKQALIEAAKRNLIDASILDKLNQDVVQSTK